MDRSTCNTCRRTIRSIFDEEPHVAHYFRRIAAFSRLCRFDVRGIGLSDPSSAELPMSVESMAADVLAVLDARGVDRTVLVGESGGGLAAIHLAATCPERVESLVLVNAFARAIADDDNPEGHPRELVDAFLQINADPSESWSSKGTTIRP
jgi:pimeloyl-ACP methyl ester carboxylesterase